LAGLGSAALACSGSIDAPVNDERDAGIGGAGVGAGGSSGSPPEPDGAGGSGGAAGNSGVGGSSSAGTGGISGTGGTSSSAGSGGSSSINDGPFCDAVEEVFLPSCGTGSCHSNPNATIGDFAVGREEAESFVDVPSRRNPVCGLFIDSADPSQSLLLRKLTGDFETPTCGGLMPVIGRDLTREEIDCVGSWLQQFQR
jgi:hypothetical protein